MDPDSRAVVFQRNSVKIGYNVQAASDAKNKLLVAADTGDVNDTKALAVMVGKAQENIGDVKNVLADKGYHSGRELKKCEELGVATYISPKESSSSKADPDFAMKSFIYNQVDGTYTCPAMQTLRTNGRWYDKKLNNGRKSYKVKHYKTKACDGCALRNRCTTNKRGRCIERTEYQGYTDRNNARVSENPEYYRHGQQIIEHQFGTLKRQWYFDHTLTRTKEKVLGEVYLAFTCYNLKRTLSIPGFEVLMAKIKAILPRFLTMYVLFKIKKRPFKPFFTKNMISITNKNNFYIFEYIKQG